MAKPADAILVDAHNLLYRRNDIGPGLDRDAEATRRALEDRLIGRKRIWLFYDGGPGGRRTHNERHGLQIIYSGGNREADDLIVGWLARHHANALTLSPATML